MHCYREVSLGTRYGETMVINKIKKTIVGSRIVFNLMGGMIVIIRGNLGSKTGLIRKRAKISFCELEFKNQ